MQQNSANYFEWTQKYSTHATCLEESNRHRQINGFIYWNCGRQVSRTDGTVFELTRLWLKWFAAVYLMSVDNGSISPEQISKVIGLAERLSNANEIAPVHGGDGYWLNGTVEVNDAFVGGRKPSKRDCVANGKKPVMFTVEYL